MSLGQARTSSTLDARGGLDAEALPDPEDKRREHEEVGDEG